MESIAQVKGPKRRVNLWLNRTRFGRGLCLTSCVFISDQKVLTSGFALDLGPLKEPLAFIRLLEWVRLFKTLSVVVFSGCTALLWATIDELSNGAGLVILCNHISHAFKAFLILRACVCNRNVGPLTVRSQMIHLTFSLTKTE